MENKQIKILMLGDHSVGKTSLYVTFETGTFPTVINSFHSWASLMIVDNIKFRIEVWDTDGRDEYDHISRLLYPNTDVFFYVFLLSQKNHFKI